MTIFSLLTCFLLLLLLRNIEGVENLEVTGEVIGIRRPGLRSFSIDRPSNLYSKGKHHGIIHHFRVFFFTTILKLSADLATNIAKV